MEEIEHSSAEIGKHASDVCGRWLMLYRLQRLVLWNAGIKALWGFCRLALTIVSHKTWTHTLYQSGILLLVVLAYLSPGRVAVCRFRTKKPLSYLNCQCHRSSFARPSREDIFVAVQFLLDLFHHLVVVHLLLPTAAARVPDENTRSETNWQMRKCKWLIFLSFTHLIYLFSETECTNCKKFFFKNKKAALGETKWSQM